MAVSSQFQFTDPSPMTKRQRIMAGNGRWEGGPPGRESGTVGEKKGAPAKKLRLAFGILVACTCVVLVISTAEERLAGDVRERNMALHRVGGLEGLSDEASAQEGVPMTPELARGLLDLPEKDQEALMMRPGDRERQLNILEKVALHQEHHEKEEGQIDHKKYSHHGLEMHAEAHTATPAQKRVQRQWALIFVTAIVTCSVTFETAKEITIENTPETMIKVVEKFFGELATLGFIGMISFVLTTDFGDSESILGSLSFTYTGDADLLIHEFHTLHFLIFFVMVFFVTAVLVTLQRAIQQKKSWSSYEDQYDLLLKKPDLEKDELLKIMMTPQLPQGSEGTVTIEYSMSDDMRRAHFLLCRQRFLDDPECSVKIPLDFDFALYLTKRISTILAEVVEIGVGDWVILWIVYLILFLTNAICQHVYHSERESLVPIYIIMGLFILLQVIIFYLAMSLFRMLAYIKHMLAPMPVTGMGAGFYGSWKLAGEAQTMRDLANDRAARLRVALIDPPFMTKMKLVKNVSDYSTTERLFSFIFPMGMANRHEQLFGFFGPHGPHHILSCLKLVLLGSVVSIAALVTIFFPYFWAVSPVLFLASLLPACFAIFLTPRMVVMYTWACSTEMMKDTDTIIEVVRKQKTEKLINILRILSMLSFFLDQEKLQIAFLKEISAGRGQSDQGAISDECWNKLVAETEPKVLEDLEALFNAFDDDHSGELDESEVGELIAQLGTKLSPEENRNIFRIMDADGGGTVDFREFATVILHQKSTSSGKMDFRQLGEKMFAIFDQDGSGTVEQQEIVDQMSKMGKNWDHDSLAFFLSEIDKDGSGTIDKAEFLDYIKKVQGQVSS